MELGGKGGIVPALTGVGKWSHTAGSRQGGAGWCQVTPLPAAAGECGGTSPPSPGPHCLEERVDRGYNKMHPGSSATGGPLPCPSWCGGKGRPQARVL